MRQDIAYTVGNPDSYEKYMDDELCPEKGVGGVNNYCPECGDPVDYKGNVCLDCLHEACDLDW